jgi:hypothetical protein
MAATAQIFQALLTSQRAGGATLASGKAYFYYPGTTDLKTVYLDHAKQSAADNPYTLSSDGTAALYGDGLYDVKITNSALVQKFFWEDVLIRGIAGEGYYNVADYADFATAISTIGATKATLLIGTDQSVATNISIPATLEIIPINGAVITVASGKTLTYLGSTTSWPTVQIFAGSGTVAGLKEARPEWFTTNTTPGTTDMTAAIRKALNAGPCKLQTGVYGVDNLQIQTGDVLIGSGATWWQEIAQKPTGTHETILKYIGAGGANSVAVRASKKDVGVLPVWMADGSEDTFTWRMENIIIDGNDLAEYGLYGARCGMGSWINQVIVTGTKAHGVWLGQYWQANIGKLMANYNGGAGITLGINTFSWAANVFASATIAGLSAYQNGNDLVAWTTADYMSGYGIGASLSESVVINRLDSERSNGVGFLDMPRAGTSIVLGHYYEDNCLVASSSTRYQHWYAPINASVGLQERAGLHFQYTGSSGLTDAPMLKLAGTAATNFQAAPVFGRADGAMTIDADYGMYRVTGVAMQSTIRIVSHYPQYSDADSISSSQTTIYVADAAAGTGSGISALNAMGSITAALRVAKVVSTVTTINIAGVTAATDWTVDFTGITRNLTIEGGTTASITQSATATNALYVKNCLIKATFQNIPTLGRTKIENSIVKFSTCPFTITGTTITAGLLAINSKVELLASAMDLTGKTSSKRGIELNSNSIISAKTSSVTNFDAGEGVVIRTGGGQLFTDQVLIAGNINWAGESGQGAVYVPASIFLSGATK